MMRDNRDFVKLLFAACVAAFCVSWVAAAVAQVGLDEGGEILAVDLSDAPAKLSPAAEVGDVAVAVDKAKQTATVQRVVVVEETRTRGEIEGEMARIQDQIDSLTAQLAQLAQLATLYDLAPEK